MKTSNAKIKSLLALDHAYCAFTAEQLKDLSKYSKVLAGLRFSKVKSGRRTWQGVYLYSNVGPYFEFIEGIEKGHGIALSPPRPTSIDAFLLKKAFPKIKFYSRKIPYDGKIWFESLTTNDSKSTLTSIYTWVMRYHVNYNFVKIARPIQHCSIDRLHNLEVLFPKSEAPMIFDQTRWFKNKPIKKGSTVTLQIPCRDGTPFTIKYLLRSNVTRPIFKSLSLSLSPSANIKTKSSKYFALKSLGKRRLRLSAK